MIIPGISSSSESDDSLYASDYPGDRLIIPEAVCRTSWTLPRPKCYYFIDEHGECDGGWRKYHYWYQTPKRGIAKRQKKWYRMGYGGCD